MMKIQLNHFLKILCIEGMIPFLFLFLFLFLSCSPVTEFSIGGNINGLIGTVILQNNGTNNLTINSNGTFTFQTPQAKGTTYHMTVLTQPDAQICSVSNGSGTVGDAVVTNVNVVCSTNTFTVGGTVSGLSGTVIVQNNGVDNLTITSNEPFTFITPVPEGATYNMTILTQPATQTCIVTNGSGTIGSSNVTNVNVACVTNTTTLSTTGLIEYGVSGTLVQDWRESLL